MEQDKQIITGEIVNDEGHFEFSGTINEAVRRIVNEVKNLKKWVYMNGEHKVYGNDFNSEDLALLKSDLRAAGSFSIQTALKGGATPKAKVRVKGVIEKRPMSQLAKDPFHMGVRISSEKGVDKILVVISDYNGTGVKLKKYKELIASALFEGLNNVKG